LNCKPKGHLIERNKYYLPIVQPQAQETLLIPLMWIA
jgi:hypothetical protein